MGDTACSTISTPKEIRKRNTTPQWMNEERKKGNIDLNDMVSRLLNNVHDLKLCNEPKRCRMGQELISVDVFTVLEEGLCIAAR